MIKSAPGFSGLLGQVPQSHKVASHLSFKLWLALCFSRKIKLDILPQIGTNLLLRKLFVNRTFSFQISAFRASLTDVATYGHIPVPLVYTQVRNVNHSSSFLINVNRNKEDNIGFSGCDARRLHSLCRLLDWRAVAPQVRFAGN